MSAHTHISIYAIGIIGFFCTVFILESLLELVRQPKNNILVA